MSRRVLFISYFFPPVGGGSAHRNAALVRRFFDLGYEPVVITGSDDKDHYWAPNDVRGLSAVGHDVEIVRVAGPEPGASSGLRRKLERVLDLDGEWYRWWQRGALEAARAHAGSCDVIYASLEPYETARVAAQVAKESGKPWVADLLDPWALDEMRLHVTGLHRRRDTAKMRRGLASAAAIVMNTPEAAARVRRELPELAGALVEPIPVGYDPSEFDGDPPVRDDSAFRIVHTGFLHTEAGLRNRRTQRLRRVLGGAYLPADIATRSHIYLVDAIRRLRERDPEGQRVELHLAGADTPADRRVAAGCDFVHFHGFVEHERSLSLARSADLLFLPMHVPAGGHPAGLVPAKTYEYLATGRPILAAVPPGDARELLLLAGTAHVCAPTDVEAMVTAIRGELARGDRPPARPAGAVLAPYTFDSVAQRLSEVFDGVVASDAAQTVAAA